MRKFIFSCAIGLAAAVPACPASYVRVAGSNQRWVIGNDYVERQITFTPGNGLRTNALLYKPTNRDYTAFSKSRRQYGDELSISIDGQRVTGKSLSVTSADLKDVDGGKTLVLRCATRDQRYSIAIHYVVYDDSPALRKWIGITNQSGHAVTLSHLAFESIAAAPGAPTDLQINSGYGAVPRELFFTGRVSDPAVFLRNSSTKEGVAILNEAPGYLKRTDVGNGWSEQTRVMYDTDLFPFERTLQPGQTFESAKCSLVFFFDGHGFEDSHWAVPSYGARHFVRRPISRPAPWIFNTWEPFLRGINAQTVAELAPIAKTMGLSIFTIDDGWQAEYGSNEINLKNFPGGISQIQSILNQNGLKLGLWVPLAAISVKTAEYQNHPEWACRDGKGAPKFTQTASGRSAVMCLGSGYRDAALRRLEDLISRYHPAYIKVDLTTVFNAYGEAPGCYAKGHLHATWAESLTRIYEALDYIGRELHQDYPDVLVDYTFELWGEKHLIDPGLLHCADLDWLSNVDDDQPESAGPLNARMLLYQRALSIPVETMLIGNLRAPTGSSEEHFGTEIGSAPLFLGDLRQLSKAAQQDYGAKIRWYSRLRAQASLPDSFFPLGSWQQPNRSACDGFARLSRDSDGVIVLFRNQSTNRTATVQLVPPPGARYEVSSVITGTSLGEVTGIQLQQGLPISFPAHHDVEILHLRREHD